MSTRPLRILHLLPAEGFGGAERQGTLLARHLPRHGVDLLTVTGPGTRILKELSASGIPEERIQYLSSFPSEFAQPFQLNAFLSWLKDIRATIADSQSNLDAILSAGEFDAVIASRAFGWIVASPIAKAHRIPCYWRAGSRVQGLLLRIALKTWQKLYPPEAVLVNCQAVAHSVANLVNSPLLLLPNIVDTQRFHQKAGVPLYRNGDSPVIGIPARPSPDKGMDYLRFVVKSITSSVPNARILFAGEFGWRQKIAEDFATDGTAQSVCFLGDVEHMEDFYASCDIVLLTSREHSIEGYPNALLEACAMGKPCVATAVGGIPELIQDGRSGLLADPDNPESCVNAILWLLQDTGRQKMLGNAARAYAESHQGDSIAKALANTVATRRKPHAEFQKDADNPYAGLACRELRPGLAS